MGHLMDVIIQRPETFQLQAQMHFLGYMKN